MFVAGSKADTFQADAPVVAAKLSSDRRRIAIMTARKLEVRAFLDKIGKRIVQYTPDKQKFDYGGEGNNLIWLGERNICISTVRNVLAFFTINDNSIFIEAILPSFPTNITAWAYTSETLVVAETGPILHLCSCAGEHLSTIHMAPENLTNIVSLTIPLSYAFAVFKDGTMGSFMLKHKDIFSKKPAVVQVMRFKDVAQVELSPDNEHLAFSTKDGTLFYLDNFSPSAEPIEVCKGCNFFTWDEVSENIFAISLNGSILIYNQLRNKSMRTRISIPLGANITHMDYDHDYNQLVLFTPLGIITIQLATTDRYIPSLVFHTYDRIFFPKFGDSIPGPEELISRGFTIKYAAAYPNRSVIVIAGRRGFARKASSKDSWTFSADRFHQCKALWYMMQHFCCVVSDSEQTNWKLLVLSPVDLSIVDTFALTEPVVAVSYHGPRILVSSRKCVRIFHFTGGKLKVVLSYRTAEKIVQAMLYDQVRQTAILTADHQLTFYPAGVVAKTNVLSIAQSVDGDILFVVTDRQQLAYIQEQWIQLPEVGELADGVFLYSVPAQYAVSKFKLKKSNFLTAFINSALDDPTLMSSVSISYLRCEGALMSLVSGLGMAISQEKVDSYVKFLENIGKARDLVLVTGLFELDEKFQAKIIEMLPPYDKLEKKFPLLKDNLRDVYEHQGEE